MVPPMPNLARKDRGRCGLAGAGACGAVGSVMAVGGESLFHSEVVRLSVQLLERLEAPRVGSDADTPTAQTPTRASTSCAISLPLMGPLQPVMTSVFEALQLCLLSKLHVGAMPRAAVDVGHASGARAAGRARRSSRRRHASTSVCRFRAGAHA